MEKRELKEGDVVQLCGCKNKAFEYCFMTVTDPKNFGAQGYVQALGTREEIGSRAYYRATWKEMEYVGKAVFVSQ